MIFSKFKAISSPEIHEAVRSSCGAVNGIYTARYFLHKGNLVIVYDWRGSKEKLANTPEYQVCKDVLTRALPKLKYQNFEIWDKSRLDEIPEKVLNKTGFVCLGRMQAS